MFTFPSIGWNVVGFSSDDSSECAALVTQAQYGDAARRESIYGSIGRWQRPIYPAVPANTYDWPVSREARLPDEALDEIHAQQSIESCETQDAQREPVRATTSTRDVRVDGIPSDPNLNKRDLRERRRVRHSVVDGRWRYVTIRVYPTQLPDYAADEIVGQSSRDLPLSGPRRKKVVNGKRVNLPREPIAPLPDHLPTREPLGAADRELLDLARQREPVIAAGLEAGESRSEIARRLGVTHQTVGRRIAALAESLSR